MLRVDTYELHRQCGTWDTVFAGTDEVPLALLGNEDGVVEPSRERADWGNSSTVTSGLPGNISLLYNVESICSALNIGFVSMLQV